MLIRVRTRWRKWRVPARRANRANYWWSDSKTNQKAEIPWCRKANPRRSRVATKEHRWSIFRRYLPKKTIILTVGLPTLTSESIGSRKKFSVPRSSAKTKSKSKFRTWRPIPNSSRATPNLILLSILRILLRTCRIWLSSKRTPRTFLECKSLSPFRKRMSYSQQNLASETSKIIWATKRRMISRFNMIKSRVSSWRSPSSQAIENSSKGMT